MTRILFAHQVSSIGGGSYCLLSLLKSLDRNCYEPVVMLKEHGPLEDELLKLDIEVFFFPQLDIIPYNQTLFSLKSVKAYVRAFNGASKFTSILKKHNVDIVYLNNMLLYPYLKYAKKAGCKTVIHAREHWPEDQHQQQMDRIRKYVGSYADQIIAINRYSAAQFNNCKEKVNIIYDWINLDERYIERPFSDIFGEDCSKLKVMLFTGGLSRIKGTMEVIQTFIEHVKGDEYRLLILGSGFDKEHVGLKKIAVKIAGSIGRRPYSQIVRDLVRSDSRIKILPPTYQLTDIYRQAYCTLSFFGIPHANLALAEAIEAGTIAIAAETDESVEYSDNGKGAVLFKFGDRNDFISKIKYVEENYDTVKKQVEGSADTVRMMFDQKRNTEELNRILGILSGQVEN